MAKQSIVITVEEQKGECGFGHSQNQEFIFEGKLPDICPAAWNSLYSSLRTLWHGGDFSWEKEGECHIACTDHKNPVVFKLKRKKE